MWVSFAAVSAGQLHRFYSSNRFCGCCGSPMMKSKKRTIHGLLLLRQYRLPKDCSSRHCGCYLQRKASADQVCGKRIHPVCLIAGYTEFGETLEDTVNREVMEETGLRVKNIRYYKNQPWAFSDSILVGYWAELDGSPQVRLDETELSTADWMAPEDIPDDFTNLSLTHEMILLFKDGKVK